jgi:hypothetical protein
MKRTKLSYLAVNSVLLLFLVFGCRGYGTLKLAPEDKAPVIIEQLKEDFDSFDIYYFPYISDHPAAVLFDPKDETRRILTTAGWYKVESPERLKFVIDQAQQWYTPTLREIHGPDSQFYGYLYTEWDYAYIEAVSDDTLRVYDLDPPPLENF